MSSGQVALETPTVNEWWLSINVEMRSIRDIFPYRFSGEYRLISTKMEDRFLDSISQQFESVFQNHPDAAFVIDMDGNYRYCNPALIRIYGYSAEELINHPFPRAAQGGDKQKLLMHLELAMQGEPQQTDVAVRNKAGETIYLQVTLVPAVVEGEVVAVHGFSKDISELVRTQQELKNNQLSL